METCFHPGPFGPAGEFQRIGRPGFRLPIRVACFTWAPGFSKPQRFAPRAPRFAWRPLYSVFKERPESCDPNGGSLPAASGPRNVFSGHPQNPHYTASLRFVKPSKSSS